MKAGMTTLLFALGLTATFVLPCFAQDDSYGSTRTATASAADTSVEDGANSWQQSINDAVHNAEAATEMAYNKAASSVKNLSLVARIKAVLHENKSTRDAEIYVAADNGVVTLTGSVPSESSAQQVEEVVAGIYGVRAVINHLYYSHIDGFAAARKSDSAGIAAPAYGNDTSTDYAWSR